MLKEGECGICCENLFVEGDATGMEDMVPLRDKPRLGECPSGVIDLFLLGTEGGSGDALISSERWMRERSQVASCMGEEVDTEDGGVAIARASWSFKILISSLASSMLVSYAGWLSS